MSGINNINKPSTSQANQAGSDNVQNSQANRSDVDRFRDSMKKKEGKAEERDAREHKTDERNKDVPADRQPSQSPLQGMGGDAILRGLQGNAPKTTAPETAAGPDFDKAQAVVDRILVSADKTDGTQEIRIQLKEDVLAGTEIRLTKSDGKLSVSLVTTDNSSHAFLSDHKQGLQTQLANRVGGEVSVDLTFDEGRDQQGEQQDGRSRQQRNIYDELEDV